MALDKPEYMEPLPDIKLDIDLMVHEFKSVRHLSRFVKKPNTNIIVQHYLGLVTDDQEDTETLKQIPYTAKIINELREKYEFDTVKYLQLLPYCCYSWHIDYGEVCLNIPLMTSEGCRFVYEDRVFHMPADGKIYVVSNDKPHTFANSGSTIRTHLVLENMNKKTKINK